MSNKCICGNCKHYNSDECYCMARGEFELYEQDTCDNWEDDSALTKEEEDEIIGDREAHERMERGEIE